MSEHTKVLVGENTREQIAYKLLDKVFVAEGKTLTSRNREDILRTYVQCYSAAGGVYVEYDDTA